VIIICSHSFLQYLCILGDDAGVTLLVCNQLSLGCVGVTCTMVAAEVCAQRKHGVQWHPLLFAFIDSFSQPGLAVPGMTALLSGESVVTVYHGCVRWLPPRTFTSSC
jgi:hypothetical protein